MSNLDAAASLRKELAAAADSSDRQKILADLRNLLNEYDDGQALDGTTHRDRSSKASVNSNYSKDCTKLGKTPAHELKVKKLNTSNSKQAAAGGSVVSMLDKKAGTASSLETTPTNGVITSSGKQMKRLDNELEAEIWGKTKTSSTKKSTSKKSSEGPPSIITDNLTEPSIFAPPTRKASPPKSEDVPVEVAAIRGPYSPKSIHDQQREALFGTNLSGSGTSTTTLIPAVGTATSTAYQQQHLLIGLGGGVAQQLHHGGGAYPPNTSSSTNAPTTNSTTTNPALVNPGTHPLLMPLPPHFNFGPNFTTMQPSFGGLADPFVGQQFHFQQQSNSASTSFGSAGGGLQGQSTSAGVNGTTAGNANHGTFVENQMLYPIPAFPGTTGATTASRLYTTGNGLVVAASSTQSSVVPNQPPSGPGSVGNQHLSPVQRILANGRNNIIPHNYNVYSGSGNIKVVNQAEVGLQQGGPAGHLGSCLSTTLPQAQWQQRFFPGSQRVTPSSERVTPNSQRGTPSSQRVTPSSDPTSTTLTHATTIPSPMVVMSAPPSYHRPSRDHHAANPLDLMATLDEGDEEELLRSNTNSHSHVSKKMLSELESNGAVTPSGTPPLDEHFLANHARGGGGGACSSSSGAQSRSTSRTPQQQHAAARGMRAGGPLQPEGEAAANVTSVSSPTHQRQIVVTSPSNNTSTSKSDNKNKNNTNANSPTNKSNPNPKSSPVVPGLGSIADLKNGGEDELAEKTSSFTNKSPLKLYMRSYSTPASPAGNFRDPGLVDDADDGTLLKSYSQREEAGPSRYIMSSYKKRPKQRTVSAGCSPYPPYVSYEDDTVPVGVEAYVGSCTNTTSAGVDGGAAKHDQSKVDAASTVKMVLTGFGGENSIKAEDSSKAGSSKADSSCEDLNMLLPIPMPVMPLVGPGGQPQQLVHQLELGLGFSFDDPFPQLFGIKANEAAAAVTAPPPAQLPPDHGHDEAKRPTLLTAISNSPTQSKKSTGSNNGTPKIMKLSTEIKERKEKAADSTEGREKAEEVVTLENLQTYANDTKRISKLSSKAVEALEARDAKKATPFEPQFRVCGNPLCRRKWKQLTASMLPSFCPSCRRVLELNAHEAIEKERQRQDTTTGEDSGEHALPSRADILCRLYDSWYDDYHLLSEVVEIPPAPMPLRGRNYFTVGPDVPESLTEAEEALFVNAMHVSFPIVLPHTSVVKNWNSMLVRKKYLRGKVTSKNGHLCKIDADLELTEKLEPTQTKLKETILFFDFRDALDVGDQIPFLAIPNPVMAERSFVPKLCKLIREEEEGAGEGDRDSSVARKNSKAASTITTKKSEISRNNSRFVDSRESFGSPGGGGRSPYLQGASSISKGYNMGYSKSPMLKGAAAMGKDGGKDNNYYNLVELQVQSTSNYIYMNKDKNTNSFFHNNNHVSYSWDNNAACDNYHAASYGSGSVATAGSGKGGKKSGSTSPYNSSYGTSKGGAGGMGIMDRTSPYTSFYATTGGNMSPMSMQGKGPWRRSDWGGKSNTPILVPPSPYLQSSLANPNPNEGKGNKNNTYSTS
ncbi:unnamed protein product [Amoebophrya sp. A25]|nr:unnamed protein product [Amoebophrya sp. A25]|eukprot:GSA25T00007414001.1